MTSPYRAANISAAKAEHLQGRAIWQLNEIARLAEVTLSTTYKEMMNGIINICVEKTGLDGQVRTDSLSARLGKNGFVKPLADAIASSWRVALAAVQEALLADMPSNPAVKKAVAMTHAQITEQAPTPFVRELLRWLGAAEGSVESQATSVGRVGEILQPLFAFQCEALRLKCLAHVETLEPAQ